MDQRPVPAVEFKTVLFYADIPPAIGDCRSFHFSRLLNYAVLLLESLLRRLHALNAESIVLSDPDGPLVWQ